MRPRKQPLCIRWTVGDVSARGWEALRLSTHCAWRLFGAAADYVVCVNSVRLHQARTLAGPLPAAVRWLAVSLSTMPGFLQAHLPAGMAEGVGWKLLPLRLSPRGHELSLDNDCLLWRLPDAVAQWLASDDRTLMAADIERCLGKFQGDPSVREPINSGIRGLPPGYDLGAALERVLGETNLPEGEPLLLESELDEQGLQAAALHRGGAPLVVPTRDVSICSPFWPRQPEPGAYGAHFVGLNSRHIPWDYFDEPGDLVRRRHWDRHRPLLYAYAGLPLPPALPLDEAEAIAALQQRHRGRLGGRGRLNQLLP